ncbi:MAG: enoyl-CoA hydratase/isomerase family protein [Acidimicrobiales bacterium]
MRGGPAARSCGGTLGLAGLEVLDPTGRPPLGVTAGRPFVAVQLGGDAGAPGPSPGGGGRLAEDDLAVPGCVVAGVASGDRLPADPPALDLLLTDRPDPPAPWVGCPDLAGALGRLESACERAPLAATTLAELLRLSSRLSVPAALVAESLAYGMLQAGPEHRRWLEGRRAAPARARAVSTGPPVVTERRGDELSVLLDRPDVHNAYDSAMRDGLVEALQLAVADATLRRVVLRGAGRSFCSGGDLDEFGSAPDPATAHAVRMAAGAAQWLHRCADRVRVEVHGACIGAGLELAALAGEVVAAADSWFSLPEVQMGLVPGAGGTASLPRRAARQRVAYLAITGVALDAATAAAWGLVDEVVGG